MEKCSSLYCDNDASDNRKDGLCERCGKDYDYEGACDSQAARRFEEAAYGSRDEDY